MLEFKEIFSVTREEKKEKEPFKPKYLFSSFDQKLPLKSRCSTLDNIKKTSHFIFTMFGVALMPFFSFFFKFITFISANSKRSVFSYILKE